MQVPTGVVAGFIGLNGAGKTTIRMLLGLIRPGDGAAGVLGRAVSYPAAYLHQVGATIEGPAFCPTPSAATTDARGDAHD